jgi:hypothetical protein
LYIGYPALSDITLPSAFVDLPIVEYENSESNTRLIIHLSYYGSSYTWEENPSYGIAWDSLPTVDRLLQAFESSIESRFRSTGPFCHIQDALRLFCNAYCNSLAGVPLVR